MLRLMDPAWSAVEHFNGEQYNANVDFYIYFVSETQQKWFNLQKAILLLPCCALQI